MWPRIFLEVTTLLEGHTYEVFRKDVYFQCEIHILPKIAFGRELRIKQKKLKG